MALFKGQLEIDEERGVIYFHHNGTGATLLRIQDLPVPIPVPSAGEGLDINVREGHARFSWLGEEARK